VHFFALYLVAEERFTSVLKFQFNQESNNSKSSMKPNILPLRFFAKISDRKEINSQRSDSQIASSYGSDRRRTRRGSVFARGDSPVLSDSGPVSLSKVDRFFMRT